jgi:GPI mannosyltransferase 2
MIVGAVAGIAISNICHLLSVLQLYGLSRSLFSRVSPGNSSISLVIAILLVISPAGAFLAAPYSESLFSFLNCLGFYLYLSGLQKFRQGRRLRCEIETLAAGAAFGCATTVRSNGLLSGALFLYDFALTGEQIITEGLSTARLRRLIALGVGGCLIALGTIIPQYSVYTKYCTHVAAESEIRPWCHKLVPSIYAWVQSHYWYGRRLFSPCGNYLQ